MKPIKEQHDYTQTGLGDVDKNIKEDEDTLGPICTCGRMSSSDTMMTVAMAMDKQLNPVNNSFSGGNINDEMRNISCGDTKKNPVWLESFFVHLMTPRNNIRTTKDYKEHHQQQHYSQHGFLERHQHILKLAEAAHMNCDGLDYIDNNNNNRDKCDGRVELCVECIDRVAAALEADSQRLYAEIEVYQETVQTAKQRMKYLQKTTKHVTDASIAANTILQEESTADQANGNSNNTIEEAYRQEIAMLEQEVQGRCDELFHYKNLHKEQRSITCKLSLLEEGLQLEQNSLELQSRAFDNRRHILTKTLSEVQNEVDKLTCVALPRVLFDLQVDQARGLHYPLINQLRLAFRPKGDVPVQEIQVAWSQATQLLLVLGNLLEYPSLDWKLVPLADCAKLIYRKEIFNLEPGDCRSLIAWNALLDQIVKHALSLKVGDGGGGNKANHISVFSKNHHQYGDIINTKPPYTSSPTIIGNTELARLDPIDHVGWSQVIHRMASNLLWLSNRASGLAATQVSSMAHCVV